MRSLKRKSPKAIESVTLNVAFKSWLTCLIRSFKDSTACSTLSRVKRGGLAPHYPLEVTRDGHLDSLSVQVECTDGAAGDSGLRDRLTIELQRDIKDVVGISARVVVQKPGTLERSAGKARRVVDKRNLT